MLDKFKTYKMSISLHEFCESLQLPSYLKLQLLRASSSVTLNLAEGSGRKSMKDRKHFFTVSLGSLREVRAVMDLSKKSNPEIDDLIDHINACLYKLSH